MGRMKVGIAVAGVIVALLGVGAAVATRSDGGSKHADPVASTAAVDASTTPGVTVVPTPVSPASAPAPAPNAKTAPTTTARVAAGATSNPGVAPPGHPSAEDIQKVIAGLTSQLLAPADTSATTQPLTKAQVEAQLRAQLKQLGITY
jgi:hypothetical protein